MTAAIAQAPALTTRVPDLAARPAAPDRRTLIAVRDRLAMQRQIFFVATGGFDSHDDQVVNQPDLLGNVSACLAAFYRGHRRARRRAGGHDVHAVGLRPHAHFERRRHRPRVGRRAARRRPGRARPTPLRPLSEPRAQRPGRRRRRPHDSQRVGRSVRRNARPLVRHRRRAICRASHRTSAISPNEISGS